MAEKTTQIVLQTRPEDHDNHDFGEHLFDVQDIDLAPPAAGFVTIKLTHMSCDPTQRIWVADVPQYMPAVTVGDPMRALVAGTVVATGDAGFAVGDTVAAFGVWKRHLTMPAGQLNKIPAGVPVELALAASLTTETAYIGLFLEGGLKAGDSVFVSGAAGATGSACIQMCKIAGAFVVGTAGSDEKCKSVLALGADACINYKTENVGERLKEIFAPRGGIDLFFDNVGGDILDDALANIAMWGRVIICGAISTYNDIGVVTAPGPKNYQMLLMRRATMRGFIFMDHAHYVAEAKKKIQAWLQAGKLTLKIDKVEAPFADAPKVVARLFSGANHGKLIHAISD